MMLPDHRRFVRMPLPDAPLEEYERFARELKVASEKNYRELVITFWIIIVTTVLGLSVVLALALAP